MALIIKQKKCKTKRISSDTAMRIRMQTETFFFVEINREFV